LVAHMQSPLVPAVHLNTRFIVTSRAWFGGGFDLTAMFRDEPAERDYNIQLRNACDRHDPSYYERFKTWCDKYFFLKHRGEPRGVGGIFFDDLAEPDFDGAFALVRSVGDHFFTAYTPIVERRRDMPYGARERAFQAYRRRRDA